MSNNILVIAEQSGGELKKVTFQALGEATRLAQKTGGAVEAALLGSGVKGLADTLAQYGASKVYVADHSALASYTYETYAAVLADLIKKTDPAVVFTGATAQGKDLAPRLAARLNTGLATDCIAFDVGGDGRLSIIRPIYAGRAIATVIVKTRPQMATLRPNTFAALNPDASKKAAIEEVPVNVGEAKVKLVNTLKSEGKRVDLGDANIIVSGGRGMGGPDGFVVIEALAEVLGAAVGASRAAVDAGWRPHSDQVGQTGRTVSPSLYIACGISGATQHLAGMKTSKYIVAVNKDPEAPIFKVADYGIVGDLFQVVPVMTEEFKKLKAGS